MEKERISLRRSDSNNKLIMTVYDSALSFFL